MSYLCKIKVTRHFDARVEIDESKRTDALVSLCVGAVIVVLVTDFVNGLEAVGDVGVVVDEL